MVVVRGEGEKQGSLMVESIDKLRNFSVCQKKVLAKEHHLPADNITTQRRSLRKICLLRIHCTD